MKQDPAIQVIQTRSVGRLKFVLLFLCFFLSVTAFSVNAEQEEAVLAESFQPGDPAQQLLDDVIFRLPREPLLIEGDLNVRKRHGIEVGALNFEMYLNWRDEPTLARYTIRDEFGSDLEKMIVRRVKDQAPVFTYLSGSPLAEAPLPDLYKPIRETDVSWMDLTLSFLWWKGGVVTGSEEIRGRNCYIVNIPAPASERDGQYSRVVLWIDKKLRMLLQAEGYDSEDGLLRKLWIKSFKKIEDRWMIKDMEIESYPLVHRTKLRVREVKYNGNTSD